MVVTRLILSRASEPAVYLIFSLGVGMLTNVLVVTVLWAIGQSYLLFMLPILAGGTVIVRLRRANLTELLDGCKLGRDGLGWTLGTLFACFTALLGVGFILSSTYSDPYSTHLAFEGIVIRGLELGRPPPNLLLPEVVWSYNYAVHLWLMGVELTSGVPIDVLVTRFGPVFLCGASAALMMAFGRYMVGLTWWVAILPVICVYWVIGIPPISGGLFASFMPYGANLILSPYFAIIVFFVTLAFVSEEYSRASLAVVARSATLIVLMFLATGARGVCPPILLCALALRLVVSSLRKEKLSRENAIDVVAAAIGFAAGLRFFFTIGTGFSGTGALKFNGQPFSFLASPYQTLLTLPHTLMGWGVARATRSYHSVCRDRYLSGLITYTCTNPFTCGDFGGVRGTRIYSLVGSALAGIAAHFFLRKRQGIVMYHSCIFRTSLRRCSGDGDCNS